MQDYPHLYELDTEGRQEEILRRFESYKVIEATKHKGLDGEALTSRAWSTVLKDIIYEADLQLSKEEQS